MDVLQIQLSKVYFFPSMFSSCLIVLAELSFPLSVLSDLNERVFVELWDELESCISMLFMTLLAEAQGELLTIYFLMFYLLGTC